MTDVYHNSELSQLKPSRYFVTFARKCMSKDDNARSVALFWKVWPTLPKRGGWCKLPRLLKSNLRTVLMKSFDVMLVSFNQVQVRL